MKPDQKCLLGALLLKAGQSILLTWGKSNVYYYSYYKSLDPELSVSYNTLPVAIIGLPCALLSLYSIKIAEHFGFERIIRICAFLQFFSFLIAPTMQTYGTFIFFFLVVIGFCYALLGFPLLNCLWSHYNKAEGKVTGILFGFFGFATLFFLLQVNLLCNPSNLEADQRLFVGNQEFNYFSFDVASNVPFATRISGLIAGLCCAVGSLLVNRKKDRSQLIVEMQILDPEQQILQTSQAQSSPDVGDVDSKLSMDQILKYVTREEFKTIFIAYFALTFFEITLGLNYKLYGLSKINDDKFLTWLDTAAIILGSLSNFYWGRLVDNCEFKDIFFKLFAWLFAISFLVPISINVNKEFFILVYTLLSVMSKGAIVILGPGLLKLFGERIGNQLFPVVNISALVGFIASPISQFILVPLIEFDGMFIFQSLMIGLAALKINLTSLKPIDIMIHNEI